MAKCTKNAPPPAPPPPSTYTLELTEEEAGMLCAILGRVNGVGYSTSNMWVALAEALNSGNNSFYRSTPEWARKYEPHDSSGKELLTISCGKRQR